ncbi:hypothetical protein O9992_02065 [Vibrio lentus]|nr:hypothetical protein [Vibrio lentus]
MKTKGEGRRNNTIEWSWAEALIVDDLCQRCIGTLNCSIVAVVAAPRKSNSNRFTLVHIRALTRSTKFNIKRKLGWCWTYGTRSLLDTR